MNDVCVVCLMLLALLDQIVEAVWPTLLVATLFSGIVALGGAYVDRRWMSPLFGTSFIAAILGFVIGNLAGLSREAAMGDVLPAVLSAMGALFVYLLILNKVRQARFVGAFIIVFALALASGAHWGSLKRIETANADKAKEAAAKAK